jgi:hypothetical protein
MCGPAEARDRAAVQEYQAAPSSFSAIFNLSLFDYL